MDIKRAFELFTIKQEKQADVHGYNHQAWEKEKTQKRPEVEREPRNDNDVYWVTDRQQERGGIGDESTAKKVTEELGKINDFSEEEKIELYHTIGMGALKYFLLKVDPKKRLLFDPNESVDFQGHTGPFIQYTHARIKSVLSRANITNVEAQPTELAPAERDLIVILTQFTEVIKQAAASFNPGAIANYVYEIAKAYNKFYHDHSILQAEDELVKQFRLQLSLASAKVISKGMALLGIAVPERM